MRAVGYACAPPDDRAPEVPADVRERLGVILPGAGLGAQQAAIVDACTKRGWELGDVFVDVPGPDARDGRSGHVRALEELERGRADVLVAAKLDTVCPWSELLDLLDRGEREGWDLVALDFALDTLTADGRTALRSLGAQARALPRSELPIPPAELMFRVIGSDSPGRFEVGGHVDLQELDRVLSAHGRPLAHFGDILDFGCGPGRFLRQLRAIAPGARLCGVDQDMEAIAWIRSELPFVETAVGGPLPPLPLPEGSFDLTIVFSVFTHLDEAYQDAWLAELRRLTRPGGLVVATVHGMSKWEAIRSGHMAGEPGLEQMAAEFAGRGFLHWTGDDWGAFFPDYYHTSFHREDYIRDRWARWFDVVDVVEPQPTQPGHHIVLSGHDIVLLRARGRRRGLLALDRPRLRRSALARQVRERFGTKAR
ncbi:MAG: methyltransferase domain-containing protein [Actinomycetota bacterium]|nr:methyltransferase domain-containing protein [Actinomycetota bacterium]MDQ3720794.1 methyltransferase domain-containing protein [Actinomycetota bacterium]